MAGNRVIIKSLCKNLCRIKWLGHLSYEDFVSTISRSPERKEIRSCKKMKVQNSEKWKPAEEHDKLFCRHGRQNLRGFSMRISSDTG